MKKIYVLLLIIGVAISLSISNSTVSASPVAQEEVTTNAVFTDITPTSWAKNEIMQLVEMGILTGYRDKQFRPYMEMTIGDAAQAFMKALDLQEIPYEPVYKDVESDSPYQAAVMAVTKAGIFSKQTNDVFGVDEPLTYAQLESALTNAFYLQNDIDWKKFVPKYSINSISVNGLFKKQAIVNRATFAMILHHTLVEKGKIDARKDYELTNINLSNNFSPIYSNVELMKVSFDENPIYLRSTENIVFMNHTRIDNSFSRDNRYTYKVGKKGATIELTVRSFDNGDYFLFSTFDNPTNSAITVDVIQKENDIDSFDLYRYDRYPIKRTNPDSFETDTTSYPTGLMRFVKADGTVKERMVGQSYVSNQLALTYSNGGYSYMRELLGEKESLSYAQVGSTLLSMHSLQSKGNDIVDQWYMNADGQLFETNENMESWMAESSRYYKKRNNWYTADGTYNKMVTTTEPMPENGQGYGRSLLLLKEDRALVLYHQQKDRYFENLVHNAFVNLKNFKEDKKYWETEVTSTYLKSLYGITAPFVDTRFNEQIALFYYNSGDEFGVGNTKEPLRNYADLLVSQKAKGNVIPVGEDSYYISDYFPIGQDVTTHASMNHVLGGMNILLMAYHEFQDEKYLDTARAIQTAVATKKDEWIRGNGDIWYRISADHKYKGDDYKHLTLEDLINSYKLWRDIDPTYLPVLEEMIASKASYLSKENLGYTTKIKNGLNDIGLIKYLPQGNELTDAL